MNKLFVSLFLWMPLAASAEAYFECNLTSDPLITKACASPTTVEKARRFNATYQRVFAESKSYNDVKAALKIKNDYRIDVMRCRGAQDTFTTCLEEALDKSVAALNQQYVYEGDSLSLDGNALKEAAHKNVALLKDDARKVPTQCMKDEAKKLDDNVSPASDIAVGVAKSCKPKAIEFATFANDTLILWDVLEIIPRMNSDQVNDLSERTFGVQAAAQAVLETRVEKYKAETKNPKAKKRKSKVGQNNT
jgi:uncharacterized protein